jgi:hypothetical protein
MFRERGNLCNLNSMLKIITAICTHVRKNAWPRGWEKWWI